MDKHDSPFLIFIIIEKLFLGTIFVAISVGVLSLLNKDMVVYADQLAFFLNLDLDKVYILEFIEWLTNIKTGTIIGISGSMLVMGTLDLLEAYGLHRRRRWAEWLTVIATGLFIPFEIYEVILKVTPIRVGMLVLNVAIVYYLAKNKELFPKKGFLFAWF